MKTFDTLKEEDLILCVRNDKHDKKAHPHFKVGKKYKESDITSTVIYSERCLRSFFIVVFSLIRLKYFIISYYFL